MPQATPVVQAVVHAALPEPSLQTRHDWQLAEVEALLDAPFNDLIYWAQTAHRTYFDANAIQLSTLLNIKTGGCPEDCAYCPQSVRYQTGVEAQPVMSVEQVRTAAQAAKANGATRFCMGAAWRSPKDKDLDHIEALISEVKALGLESCATLGMLTASQADRLHAAGLDFYNHNLDSSESFYQQVISTRTYQDRLDTLSHVQQAGMKVCCGGIVGMGEKPTDRAQLLQTLANFPKHPESVPINALVRVAGTPLDEADPIEPFVLIRTIAAARIMMPASFVRLSAGRTDLSKEQQALCFLAGANSVFYGEQLLTTPNPEADADRALFAELGLNVMGAA